MRILNLKIKNVGRKIIDNFLGVKNKIIKIKFSENNKQFNCFIPDDQLWISIKEILLIGEYERKKEFALDKISGNVLIDAGAHAGLYSLKASPYFKKIISIEPHPEIYRLLTQNIKINKVKNISPLQKALWYEEDEEMKLVESPYNTANSSLVSDNTDSRNKIFSVKTLSLKDLVSKYGKINLLKMDIEGAELEVITQTPCEILKCIDAIVAEIHACRTPVLLSQIVNKLKTCDFEVEILKRPQFYYKESVKKIIKNWKKVKGLTKLKLLSIFSFTFFKILEKSRMIHISEFEGTKMLFAKRKKNT